MKLTRLQIQNIACFEDLTLDLTDERGKPAEWVVIVGENGTGKSTLLQMLATALLGRDNLSIVAGELNSQQYIRVGSTGNVGAANLIVIIEPNDLPTYPVANRIYLGADTQYPEPSPQSPRTLFNSSYAMIDEDNVNQMVGEPYIYHVFPTGGWFASAYSPWRRLRRRNSGDNSSFPTLQDSGRPYRFATLFGDDSRLTPISWIAQLYVRTIYPNRTDTDQKKADQEKYDRVISALEKVLPDLRFVEVTPDQEVMVQEVIENKAGVIVPLERLSDGYRSTFTWILDLVRRLFDAFPDSADPLQESGVVLVDELDLHLHPKWQRRVVTDIRKLFPNLQFIVTTHSPFIAQDLTERDKIFVLERNSAGAVVARPEEGDSGAFADWSADQLYGRFFGLENGTEDESVLKQKAEYERLLDREANNALTPNQRTRLDRLRLRFSHAPLGPDATSDDYYRAADALFASLDVRRKATKRAANGNGKNGKKAEDSAS